MIRAGSLSTIPSTVLTLSNGGAPSPVLWLAWQTALVTVLVVMVTVFADEILRGFGSTELRSFPLSGCVSSFAATIPMPKFLCDNRGDLTTAQVRQAAIEQDRDHPGRERECREPDHQGDIPQVEPLQPRQPPIQ
ncbi:MAG: hypothetical protein R3B90_02500 [Planctomycetaceae bacterium]